MLILGIDIGGTSIKADLYDHNGTSQGVMQEEQTAVDLQNQTNGIFEQVCELVTRYQKQFPIAGIAISTAGVVDSQAGKILFAGPTIPGYIGLELKSELEARYHLPVSVENDVNCAALAELWQGNAKGVSSAFMITLGTGIGGALIVDEKIVTGHQFTAGEVGYLPIRGQRWETLASASALVALYEEQAQLSQQTGKTFFAAVDKHDPVAEAVCDRFLEDLAEGIVTISYLVNPEVFLIGGGIMARSDLILPKLNEKVASKIYDARFLPGKIVPAKLGNEAGRLGALKHFINNYQDSLS